jgi:magnesium transporter
MHRNVYLAPNGELTADLPEPALRLALASGEGVLWLDLDRPDEGERAVLSEMFGFHRLAIDDCFNGRVDTPKVDDYGAYLFLVAQSVRYALDDEELDIREVDVFFGRNYVVTVRTAEVPAVDELFGHALVNPHILSRGSDFLAHTVLDVLVDQLLPAVEELDDALDDLERRILDDPDRLLLQRVLRLKRHTLRLRRSILPQRDLANRLSRGEFADLIDKEALLFYRDIYDHVVRVEEMIEGLRDLADSALNSYLSAVNNRMNEVMKTLSIVAAVFLPLTLIASIYGTNLDFSPGIELKGGFFFMLGAMAVIAAGMVVYFRLRRWF